MEKVVVFARVVCASSLLRALLRIPSSLGQQVGTRVESFANPVQVGEAELQVVRDAERRLATRGVARRRDVGVYLSFGGGEFSAGEAQDRCFPAPLEPIRQRRSPLQQVKETLRRISPDG